MRRLARNLLPALFAAAAALATPAHADRIEVSVQLVRPDGAPIVGKTVRLVVGSEAGARSPGAGVSLVTDGVGKIRRVVEAPVPSRRITLDNPFAWHKVRNAAVGVELDVAGRPALYWTELDAHREGTVGQMIAYFPGGTAISTA